MPTIDPVQFVPGFVLGLLIGMASVYVLWIRGIRG